MTVKNRAQGIALAKERAKNKELKIIEETEGDFYEAHIEYPSWQTWHIANQSGEMLRGVFYPDSKRHYVFLHRHECVEDIVATSIHESIHAGIFQCIEWEYDEMEKGMLLEKYLTRMDDTEEHNMIRIAVMPEEYFGE